MLLADIEAGKIEVVAIYKIDRLTRSLADFARIIEVMEKHGASFVSVTQSFNTKTSMGRLMLHVLLSFAQFEREVGAERVRDKIAASKAKGMWMGGTVPLGYDAIDRKLVINPNEAAPVRAIFQAFAELGSVQATVRWSRRQGLRTKVRQRLGKDVGGTPFHFGALRGLLSNRTYAGEVEHKGKVYADQHEAIVERGLFDRVQEILSARSSNAQRAPKLVSASLLQGLIFDPRGRAMGPTHTSRNGQRFRYYVTRPKSMSEDEQAACRVAADPVERHCTAMLAEHLASQVSSVEGELEAKRLTATLAEGAPEERRLLLIERVRKITVGDAKLVLDLIGGSQVQRNLQRIRHGNDAKFVLGKFAHADEAKTDPQLVLLLQDAMRARALASSRLQLPLDELSASFGRSSERYKRLLRLSYLSPNIISAILKGRKPVALTSRFLQNLDGLPHSWSEQEQLLLG